ncbi:CBS domain-containing protein [Clostridium niameyense]|uniref:CBS domain-containing protein n=1 Tax=Clostridium niameyense TaxID=1622073 RepID=A0A6M0R9Z7_9CLOT|nr:sigma-54 dependent transcriptional regulator PrdR [Clostridium niameyense]NEZ46028.1 CBS domain-containing protein [Clostridium niameyense]
MNGGIELIYTVKSIMRKDFVKITSKEQVSKAILNIDKCGRDELIVVDEKDEFIGILTKDHLYKIQRKEKNSDKIVENYINKKYVTIFLEESIISAKEIMRKNKIHILPVLNKNKQVIGIVRLDDLNNELYFSIKELYNLQDKILENMHEAVCITNDKGVVIYWNKSSEELYGVKREDIIKKPIHKVFPNPLIYKVLKNPRKITNVYNEPFPGKTVILSTVPIFNSKNKLVAVVSTDRDITEVISLSKELMKEKNKVEFFESAYKKEIASNYNFSSIIGRSAKIIENIIIAKKVAPTSASVLVTGESGTGKEVFAKAIHKASGRTGNFVAINCSAIPENLFESELFGYTGGTFTGSLKEGKIGKFEFANNGTLFLDEIGDMPLSMQAKLLRVLQDGMVYRIGSQKGVKVNCRIIAATNRDLPSMIKKNTFREDLFYRFAVVQIELPPLRERQEDIKEFVDLFISQVCEKEGINISNIDKEVYKVLTEYKWEGNIRELKNVVERMVVLSTDGEVTLKSVPVYIRDYVSDIERDTFYKYDLNQVVKSTERKIIREVMALTKGNKKKAAEILNIKRSTLYYKLNQYELI